MACKAASALRLKASDVQRKPRFVEWYTWPFFVATKRWLGSLGSRTTFSACPPYGPSDSQSACRKTGDARMSSVAMKRCQEFLDQRFFIVSIPFLVNLWPPAGWDQHLKLRLKWVFVMISPERESANLLPDSRSRPKFIYHKELMSTRPDWFHSREFQNCCTGPDVEQVQGNCWKRRLVDPAGPYSHDVLLTRRRMVAQGFFPNLADREEGRPARGCKSAFSALDDPWNST